MELQLLIDKIEAGTATAKQKNEARRVIKLNKRNRKSTKRPRK